MHSEMQTKLPQRLALWRRWQTRANRRISWRCQCSILPWSPAGICSRVG